MKRSSRISKARPSSAGADSLASRRTAMSHTVGKRSATKISRPTSSTDSVSSKRDTFSGSQKRGNRRETLSSNDGAERESINCTTISSIDSESVRSESSKFRDDHSCHSRDSSVASKLCTTDKPQAQPWFIGNSRMSFNKKYGTSSKSSNKTFEVIRRNSIMKKPDTLSKLSSSKQAVRPNVEYTAHTRSNLSQLGKKPGRSSRIESKDDLKSTSVARTNHLRSTEPEKLEVIRSETEVIPKPDLSCLVNNLPARRLANDPSGRPSRSSSKFSPETLPRVELPESMDCFVEVTQQPPGEPRLKTIRSKELPNELHVENKKAEDLECSRSPWMQSQPEKFAMRYRNRRQRSRTSSPVLAKVAVLSPKIELSMETLPPKDKFHENVPVNSITNGSNEKRKERSHDWSQLLRENRKPKVGAKPDSHGKKHTPGVTKCKEGVKASSAKLTDDFNGRKAEAAMKNLGATRVKPGFSTNSKLSSSSRTLQQRVVASKVNTGLHDSVSGVRSVQIRSSKSPSNEKRILETAKPEKTGASQAAMEDNAAGGLKLPRRDSKAGIAMQVGLKKYIKKLKRVLSDRDNTNIGELASLSLTDAILPELESTLSSMEVQQVQNLLNMAEKSQS